MDQSEVMVSVVVATYNHEKYIRHTLESIVAQNVSFRYEVFVGDDCSSDNTANIVKEFAQKYPDIINAVIREKNLGASANIVDLVTRTKGQYIAFIEGDDYWIDENKLQKQVKFMEEHPDFVAVFGRCIIVDENEDIIPGLEKEKGYTKSGEEYSIKDFEKNILPGQTATSLYRRISFDELQKKLSGEINDERMMMDRGQVLFMLSLGKMYTFEDVFAAYRYVTNAKSGSWSSKHDYYSRDNIIYFLDGMKLYEKVAKKLGMSLNFDEQRCLLLANVYNNRSSFSIDDITTLKKAIKESFNSKPRYYKTRLGRFVRVLFRGIKKY